MMTKMKILTKKLKMVIGSICRRTEGHVADFLTIVIINVMRKKMIKTVDRKYL